MNKLLTFLLIITCIPAFARQGRWQQQVNFNIQVSLNDQSHSLEGFETIEYINNSPDTLKFIWFHLWPNAYKNDRTTFSEQLLANGRKDFYFSPPESKGYINRLDFKADGSPVKLEDDSANIDIVKILLPKALPPGGRTLITTPFHVQLPFNFSRGGHVGQEYQVTQWYPKPAVYDQLGWHPMPYVDQGEFYSEFGNFDVEIQVPEAYLVAGTGVLQDEEKLRQLQKNEQLTASPGVWHYKQDNIHDFAWFASKNFKVLYDTVLLSSNKIVDVFCYYHAKDQKKWALSSAYAKDGIRRYSNWLGDYPYSIASVVQGSKNENSGGMEYPTITLITTQNGGHELDATIVHEVGHNWFYGALASNERDHPWMDEGMNTYYQKRYELEKYGTYQFLQALPKGVARKSPDDEEDLLLRMMARLYKDQPIETPATKFTELNYVLIAYYKTSRWMKLLEQQLGRSFFDSSMQQYYRDWRFKHPYPTDFQHSLERASRQDLQPHFELLINTGSLPTLIESRTAKLTLFGNLKQTDKYNYISVLPAVGFNNYDKLMIGAMVHNYQLPLNKLQFAGGVLYAKGSSAMNGFGRASYNIYKKKYHLETAISGITYHQNQFTTESNTKLYLRVSRIVPSVKLSLYNKDPLAKKMFTVQFKSFLIREDGLRFSTIINAGNPPDTSDVVSLNNNSRSINQLSAAFSDERALYPYSLNVTVDQGSQFIRTGLSGKYYFNYANNKGGLKARFFAGKFFYLKAKTFQTQIETDRYHLNMTGPKGYEDYTYSGYYFGRNEFQGWMSQQIMERDGFFKVRTDLLGNKIGKTDDWLASVNLVTDFPDKLNPLSILPFRVPLKVFLDAGTYAEAWKNNPASGKFLYDAGLQVSLFGETVNIFVPLFYSKVYSNYFKSTIGEKRLQKNIAFSIDLQKLDPGKLFSGFAM